VDVENETLWMFGSGEKNHSKITYLIHWQFRARFLKLFHSVYLWTVEKWHFVAIFDFRAFDMGHLICSAYL